MHSRQQLFVHFMHVEIKCHWWCRIHFFSLSERIPRRRINVHTNTHTHLQIVNEHDLTTTNTFIYTPSGERPHHYWLYGRTNRSITPSSAGVVASLPSNDGTAARRWSVGGLRNIEIVQSASVRKSVLSMFFFTQTPNSPWEKGARTSCALRAHVDR